MLQFEFLFDLQADVGELISMGAAPLGERRVVYIQSGSFAGPQLRGEVVGGADWQIARSDGVLELDARYAIKEAGGGLIEVVSQGYRHGPADVLARLARARRSTRRATSSAPSCGSRPARRSSRGSTRRLPSPPRNAKPDASSSRRGGCCRT